MTRKLAAPAALTALVAVVAACQRTTAASAAATLVGESRALEGGSVHSWVRLDAAGHPAALGLTFSEEAVASLLAQADTSFTLALPALAALPFDHLEVEWHPQGHAPEGVYDRPHLDVRFFLVALPAREALRDPAAAARVPELDLIPGSYVPLPGLLPRAGSRWTDPTAPELSGEPLTSSLLYGFYDGQPAFLETLVARAFLEGGAERTRELKLPRRYPRPGYYPTRYRVRYEGSTREYTVALEGLVPRNSPLTPR